jgi:hypothetical protein
VVLESWMEKKSPVDGARFWSLSRTMTSKRHSGEVGVARVGHVRGKPAGRVVDVGR